MARDIFTSSEFGVFLCCHTLAVGKNAVVPYFSFIFPQDRNTVTKTTGSQNLVSSVSCKCISNAEQLSWYVSEQITAMAVLPFSIFLFFPTFEVFLRNWNASKPESKSYQEILMQIREAWKRQEL